MWMPGTRPGMTNGEDCPSPTGKSAAALFHRHGDMQIPPLKALAEAPTFGHIWR